MPAVGKRGQAYRQSSDCLQYLLLSQRYQVLETFYYLESFAVGWAALVALILSLAVQAHAVLFRIKKRMCTWVRFETNTTKTAPRFASPKVAPIQHPLAPTPRRRLLLIKCMIVLSNRWFIKKTAWTTEKNKCINNWASWNLHDEYGKKNRREKSVF